MQRWQVMSGSDAPASAAGYIKPYIFADRASCSLAGSEIEMTTGPLLSAPDKWLTIDIAVATGHQCLHAELVVERLSRAANNVATDGHSDESGLTAVT